MAAEISRIVAERYPDESNIEKISALMHAAAARISAEPGQWHDMMSKLDHFGRAFDEIILMHLSNAYRTQTRDGEDRWERL